MVNQIFQYDGPVMKAMQKLSELLILNVIWLLLSVPVVTIGASTAALYKVELNAIEKKGQPIRDFWKYFRSNFRQATMIWVILLLFGLFLLFDWYFLFRIEASLVRMTGCILMAAVSLVYIFVLTFVFPLQANFENKILGTLKNAFLVSFSNPLGSIVLAAFSAIPVLLIVFTSTGLYWLIVDVSAVVSVNAVIFDKIFNVLPQSE